MNVRVRGLIFSLGQLTPINLESGTWNLELSHGFPLLAVWRRRKLGRGLDELACAVEAFGRRAKGGQAELSRVHHRQTFGRQAEDRGARRGIEGVAAKNSPPAVGAAAGASGRDGLSPRRVDRLARPAAPRTGRGDASRSGRLLSFDLGEVASRSIFWPSAGTARRQNC